MWDPAGAVERWGNVYVAYSGVGLFVLAGLCSLGVAWCFWRDYDEASPLTRGYFQVLMWKRVAMAVMCGAQAAAFWSAKASVIVMLVGVALYVFASVVFFVVWASKGRRISKDEYLGHALRQEGLDVDTMTQPDAVSFAKKAVGIALDKTAASLSNIHHHA